ncbi:GNAT family N-acetyltransferase [Gorillibacterium sp. CAU 1737]|uniref:GNAT family N-acetyltransferase n=1 Tax=Gorillibacterium sp. CAU 1737 TaxID=3140362 RepID=UPI0032606AAA
MKDIIQMGETFPYSSMKYAEEEELALQEGDFTLTRTDAGLIVKQDKDGYHLHWAAKDVDAFLAILQDVLARIQEPASHEGKRIYLEFIEPEWIARLEQLKFRVVSHFEDYWIKDLSKPYPKGKEEIPVRLAVEADQARLSQITKACADQSRGFHGEDESFVKEWLETEHCWILAAEVEGQVAGATFVSVYGHDREAGTVLWLRELAVSPDFQKRGIGHRLVSASLDWGRAQGAKQSFLAADKLNDNAIRIYQTFGYVTQDPKGQINMALNP